jgi:hypothetical protein
MKKQITILMALVILSSNAFAQGTTKAKKQDEVSSQGFRVSIVKPMLDSEVKLSGNGASNSYSQTLDQALGLSLGYVSLPVQQLGWTANATYLDIQNNGYTTSLVRIDGNAAYAFTNIISIKGGLNITKLTGGNDAEKFDAGIGFQGGIGIQVTKNFGFDVGYTQMNQSTNLDGYDISVREAGLEIGLNGTF